MTHDLINDIRFNRKPSESVVLGEKLKAALRRELNELVLEWNCATVARRREITKIATVICDLLNEWQ